MLRLGPIVRIAVAVALVVIVVAVADWRAVWGVLRGVNLLWVGCALALAVLDRVVINVRYDILLVARGITIGFARLFRIQLAANFLGSFLPGFVGVDAARIAALCRGGQPTAPAVAATLVDRFSLAFATLLFGSATLLTLAGTRIPGHLAQYVLLVTLVAVGCIGLVLLPAVRQWAGTRLMPMVPERFRHLVASIADAALAYRHDAKALAWTSVVTLLLFLVRIAFAKSLAYACGANVAFVDLLLVIPVLWIVVMLPISVGGIGVQDAAYVLLMGIVGISPSVAFSMSILEHVVARVASLPGALFLDEVAVSKAAAAKSSG